MIGRGEVETAAGPQLHLLVAVKLGAVVGGDGLERVAVGLLETADHLQQALVERGGREVRNLPDQNDAAHALDKGHHRIAPGAVNRVDFPMTELPALLRCLWTLRDVSFPRQTTAPLFGRVPLSVFLCSLPQA